MKTSANERRYIEAFITGMWNNKVPSWFEGNERKELEVTMNNSKGQSVFKYLKRVWDMLGQPNLLDKKTYWDKNFKYELLRTMTIVENITTKHDETAVNDTVGVGQNTNVDTRNNIDIKDIKLDKRWTRNTIPKHIRRLTIQADNLTDTEILNIVHHDEYIKELQSINPLIKIR